MSDDLPSRFVIQSSDDLVFYHPDGKTPMTKDELQRRREAAKQREASQPFSFNTVIRPDE